MVDIPLKTTLVIKDKKFYIDEFISEGPSAKVWKIRDQLGYRHALKIFSPVPTMDNREFLNRLAILKKIQYQYIMPIEHFGLVPFIGQQPMIKDGCWQVADTETTLPFLIMPYAEKNLADLIVENPQPLQRIRFAIQICLGINKIHSYRMLGTDSKLERFFHGNLKPANVLLVTNGKRLVVKIADLGLDSRESASPYLAPQQRQQQEFDFRVDFFALAKLLDELLNETPPDFDKLLNAMKENASNHENFLKDALQKLWTMQKMLHRQKAAHTVLMLGISLYKQDLYQYALKDFDKVLELQPSSLTAHLYRGHCLRQLNREQEAMHSYNRALEIDDCDARVYESRGELYGEMQQFSQAIGDFEKAITLDPEAVSAYGSLGMVYTATQQYQLAKQQFDFLINKVDNFATAYVDRGDVLFHLQQYENAIADYQKALELDSSISDEVDKKIQCVQEKIQ